MPADYANEFREGVEQAVTNTVDSINLNALTQIGGNTPENTNAEVDTTVPTTLTTSTTP